MPQREFDLTRCHEAWKMHKSKRPKYTYVEIGRMLGVTPRRAEAMVETWEQHNSEQEAHADLVDWRRKLYYPEYRFEPG